MSQEVSESLKALESGLPNPLGGAIWRHRQIKRDKVGARIDSLMKLAELVAATTASIAIRRALALAEGPPERLRELLPSARQTSFGTWRNLLQAAITSGVQPGEEARLLEEISAWHESFAHGQPEVLAASERLAALYQVNAPRKGKLRHSELLLRANQVRNQASHTPGFSQAEALQACEALELLVERLLSGLGFLRDYVVVYVDEVRIRDGETELVGPVSDGRDFELQQLQTEPLRDKRLYLMRQVEGRVQFALDLSPYQLYRPCQVCGQESVFLFNKLARQAVHYSSWRCGHSLRVSDPTGEFRNIEDFLEGRIDLPALFEGRALGVGLDEINRTVSRQQRESATRLVEEGRRSLAGNVPDQAIEDANQALSEDPDSAGAHYVLALAGLLVDVPYEEVAAGLQEAVRLDPMSRQVLGSVGRIAEFFGDHDAARTSYARALSRDPANANLRERLRDLGDRESEPLDPGATARQELVRELLADDPNRLPEIRFWITALPPWSWVRRAPAAGGLLIGGLTFGAMTLSALPIDKAIHLSWFAVIAVLTALGIWLPFYVASSIRDLFGKLRGAVTLPTDSFRRWFLAELVPWVGSYHALRPDESWNVRTLFRRDPFLMWGTVLWALAFIPFQYACADGGDPFAPTPDKLVRYFFYLFEIWTLSWIPVFVWRALTFIPGFVQLPIRHFVAAPDQATLKPMGSFYLKMSYLASTVGFFFALQHFLFRTLETVLLQSATFQALAYPMMLSFVFVSQVLLVATMEKHRQRRLVEFSFYVEAAFERFLREGTAAAFEALETRREQARFLRRTLWLGGLSTWSKIGLALLALAHAVVLGVYFGAVWNMDPDPTWWCRIGETCGPS